MTDSRLRRLSREQQQEFRSRDQLADRFDEYGWIPGSIARDLGEDFLVRIYDEGVSSGLSFFVQLKSTEDLNQLMLASGDISYPLEVKDLLHWEVSAVPVFVVVWDVNSRRGCWVGVPDAIRDLDRRRPNWRRQRTARVRMPHANSTDDNGLCRLRQIVADYYYPVIARDKALEIHTRFLFPATPEGRAANIALQHHFATGAPVEIDGQFIRELRFPEWWSRLYGEIDMSEGLLGIGPSSPQETQPVRFDAISDDGRTASIPYVELRVSQAGSKQVTLTNEHQSIPLEFKLKLDRISSSFNLSINVLGPGTSAKETREILMFLRALADSGRLRITWLRSGQSSEAGFPPGALDSPNPAFVAAVEHLCLIEKETGHALPLPSDWTLDVRDQEAIDELVSIIETGQYTRHNRVITGGFSRYALNLFLEPHRAGKPIELHSMVPDGYVQLLGQKVAVGPFTRSMSGRLDLSVAELEDIVAEMESDDELEIRLVGAKVVEVFQGWPKSSLHAPGSSGLH
ncbi:DUF4365 domain-containing protein [Chloroflexota bacterium]